MAGAGAGGMVGVELTDFVFILNSAAAVKSFSEFGTVTLGGNISVSAGPLGRNAEAAASASAGGVSSVFAYSKSKGLFAGVSLEGSVIVERREANRKFYGDSCTAKMILSGRIRPPPAADPLFRVLESRAFNYRSSMPADDYNDYYDDIPDSFDSSDVSSTRPTTKSTRQTRSGSRSYFDDDEFDDDYGDNGYGGGRGSRARESYDDDFNDPSGANEYYRSYRTQGARSPRRTNTRWEDDVFDRDNDVDDLSNRFSKSRISSGAAGNVRMSRPVSEKPDFGSLSSNTPKAVALYSFAGEESGDLPFRKGDVITILKKSESQDDWWTGRVNGREGIFPANYVELV
ncbi:hypothetical protein HG537_0A06810 [Torulaspora globosa]|uniref:SH3 domain-containing protein n=1 Tax=Torulaspora globosa TaxID=48254 RepID=A0A7H9HKS9_9SACH|nr:hypothetical protein HG537_0A06810 [Torulaspora sp. CBS 2947]